MKTIVVGGGIMGLCTAWSLARRGHSVCVLDQHAIPNPWQSSGDEHRLIRHPYGAMGGYARLINPALQAWEKLWRDISVRLMVDTGTLILTSGEESWAESSLADMEALGIPFQILNESALQERVPMLRTDNLGLAAMVDSGGVLLAGRIVDCLASHLRARGVEVRPDTRVVGIDTEHCSVRLDDGATLTADHLVIAAGPWAPDLVPSLQQRVTPSRQVVLYLHSPQRYRPSWVDAPMVLDIHGHGGIYVVPPVANTGLKIGDHSFSLSGHPDEDRETTRREEEALYESCRKRFLNLDEYSIEYGKSCFYTVEKDESFIIEPIGNAYVMTGFSGHGFKFGALMGLLLADAITGGIDTEDLQAIAGGQVTDMNRIDRLTSPCLR